MLYELRDVELRYGERTALSIQALTIDRGDRLALVGPNGSGKSSLLKLLDGLAEPSRGELLKDGRRLSGRRRQQPRSVYLHQFPYLLQGTVGYNVGFGCRAADMAESETKRRTKEAMELLGLEGMEKRSHRALSGGEAQRVALARAIASGAEILLLDEPTASADSESTELIIQALRRLSEQGATMVFSTHDPRLSNSLGGRRIRLSKGKIAKEEGGRQWA